MGNDLTVQQHNEVMVIGKHELGELIQPMIREIHLFDSWIAGTTHLGDKFVLETVEAGNELKLRREDNPFDAKAILVLTEEGKKLGYVPEKDNIVFSRLMDAGKILKAKVLSVKPKGGYTQINIGIYLVDL